MMKRSLFYRAVGFALVLILSAATMDAYAETSRGVGELHHEAFLRGGTAISTALGSTESPVVSAELVPPAPPQAMNAFPQETKSRRLMLWVGIGITAAIAGYLIQRSVRNHDKIFGSAQ
jgi:hypothetical protein